MTDNRLTKFLASINNAHVGGSQLRLLDDCRGAATKSPFPVNVLAAHLVHLICSSSNAMLINIRDHSERNRGPVLGGMARKMGESDMVSLTT